MFLTWRPIWKFLFNFRVSEKFSPLDDLLCFLLLTKAALHLWSFPFCHDYRTKFHTQLQFLPLAYISEKMYSLSSWLASYPCYNRSIVPCFLYLLCHWMHITWNPLYEIHFWNLNLFCHTRNRLFLLNIRKYRKAKGKMEITLNFTKSANNFFDIIMT